MHACHFDNDLYVCYLDFSSALNMVDHDQLLRSMYDMGIPRDVIEVVKDIISTRVTAPQSHSPQVLPTTSLSRGAPSKVTPYRDLPSCLEAR